MIKLHVASGNTTSNQDQVRSTAQMSNLASSSSLAGKGRQGNMLHSSTSKGRQRNVCISSAGKGHCVNARAHHGDESPATPTPGHTDPGWTPAWGGIE